jgi:hypothetical protein
MRSSVVFGLGLLSLVACGANGPDGFGDVSSGNGAPSSDDGGQDVPSDNDDNGDEPGPDGDDDGSSESDCDDDSSGSEAGAIIDMTCHEAAQPLSSHIVSSPSGPEIHMIGIYESDIHDSVSGVFELHVDRCGEVILILSSYESVNWIISAAAGTDILAIYVEGYEESTVVAQAGVEIIDWSGVDEFVIGGTYEWTDPRAELLAGIVEEDTGAVLASFGGCYIASEASIL